MGKVLFSITWDGPKPPTLADLFEKFAIHEDEIDSEFGIVEIDPEKSLYSILVNVEVAQRLSGYDGLLKGPYSNPRIAPMDLKEEE